MAPTNTTRLPVLFISHGPGPSWLSDNINPECTSKSPSAVYLRSLRQEVLSNLPPIKALLVVSAHWHEPQYTVQVNDNPGLLYDYYGFPPETYEFKWPAPGAAEQAKRAKLALEQAGIPVRENTVRGLDHGVFVPLSLVFPEADIPVFEVSLKSNWDISDHMKMGEALAPLRDEGFLIITSGNTTHSPRSTRKNSDKFTEFMHDCMSNAAYTPGERAKKFHQACEQESFLENHPTMDHYLPMPVASAAASFAPGKLLWSGYLMGNLLASHFLFA